MCPGKLLSLFFSIFGGLFYNFVQFLMFFSDIIETTSFTKKNNHINIKHFFNLKKIKGFETSKKPFLIFKQLLFGNLKKAIF